MQGFGLNCVVNFDAKAAAPTRRSTTRILLKENLDEEWKFNRAVIWMTYFERDRVLPSPLFLIPSPNDVFRLFKWMRKKCCKKSSDSDSPDAKCGLTVRTKVNI